MLIFILGVHLFGDFRVWIFSTGNEQSFQSVIQKNALEDTAVTNKMQWDNSISFMERILKERIDFANEDLEKCIGMSKFHKLGS